MLIARTLHDLARIRADASLSPAATCALVPTMGALHQGHLSLVRAARALGHEVAVSIFVNPTQFNNADDLARYPRDEDADLALLRGSGCALVWLPSAEVMYPDAAMSSIEVAGPASDWEGAARPGHFNGVATVVCKLFNQVRPQVACFGEKDWQQLQVIRAVAADLFLAVSIEGIPTVREPDGLAMSSRNRFLEPQDRNRAPALYRCLLRVEAALLDGDPPSVVLDTAREDLRLRGFDIDYLALVDACSLRPIDDDILVSCGWSSRADQAASPATLSGARPGVPALRLIAAARLGQVRLLDNIPVSLASAIPKL